MRSMANDEKSRLKDASDSVRDTAASLAIREVNRKKRGLRRLYSSIKISLGLLASLLLLLIASSAVLLISGLIWISQNTVLSEDAAVFLSGTVVGYIASILITLAYAKYLADDRSRRT